MILRRFFRPKWQHSNPRVRRQAVLELSPAASTEILAAVATGDNVAELRGLAVERLGDLDLLRRIGERDLDGGVRRAAQRRFRDLLVGEDGGELSLEMRVRAVGDLQDLDILEYVAIHGKEADLRIAAVRMRPNEHLLEELAIRDPEPRVRLMAVEALRTPERLECVAKLARKRDKRVSRVARDKLARVLAEAERPVRLRRKAEALCLAAESLVIDAGLDALRQAIPRLRGQWEELSSESAADEGLMSRWREAEMRLSARLQQLETEAAEREAEARLWDPLRERKEELCATLESLACDLEGRNDLGAVEAGSIGSILKMTQSAFEETAPLPEPENRELLERFERLAERVRRRQQVLVERAALAAARVALCAEAEALAVNAESPTEKQAAGLRKRWVELAGSDSVPEALECRWLTALERLDQRLRESEQRRRRRLEELPDTLVALQEALDRGESQHAAALEAQARAALDQLGPGLARQAAPLRARLRRLAPRRRELSDWRRWADTREKERLCEEMEELIERFGDLPVDEIAGLVRAARAAWKALGPTEVGMGRVLWQRFDTACNRAYAPCQAEFEAQAQVREQHLASKEEICAGLEALVAVPDWEALGPPEVSEALDGAWRSWKALGLVPRREARRLRRRFEAARAPLEQRLAAQRERSRQHKEALIERVEDAVRAEDLGLAIRQTKQAQAEWRTAEPVSRRSERVLWERFRTACDAVFARRDALRAARDAALAASHTRKESLCLALEALAGASPGAALAADAVESELARVTAEWRAIDEGAPADDETLEGRFRAACVAASKLIRRARITALREGLQPLRQKAALCAEAEARESALTDGPGAAELRQRWAALDALDEQTESAIGRRLEAALGGGANPDPEQGRRLREDLCVRMELLAGIESPPEAAEARLAYQVARLARAMGQGSVPRQEQDAALAEAEQTEREWLLASPAPAPVRSALERRFQRAVEAFWQSNLACA